jgi:hypothetical protein
MTAPDLPAADALDARLAALRDAGALQREAARFHIAQALARRRAGQAGVVRQRLDARLAGLLDDLQVRLAAPVAQAAAAAPVAPGPLALLCADLVPGSGRPGELRTVQQFGATWARLRVDQQLRRASGRQRGQAGPLNSQRLMLQALQQLRRLSPAYLQRFMAQAETLLWLDDQDAVAAATAPAPTSAPPPTVRRRTTGRRPAR